MGSFYMNASFSKLPLEWNRKTKVVICLSRKIDNKYSLMPLTYPVTGTYYDYGLVKVFEKNEITEAICKFFEMESMNEVISFIYDMTIHGDYDLDLNLLKRGDSLWRPEEFHKYESILKKLIDNSGVEIESEDEIRSYCSANFDDNQESKERITDWILNCNLSKKEMLDSYRLALFYEHDEIFDALCTEDRWYKVNNDNMDSLLERFADYAVDSKNLFFITKDCNSQETQKIKRNLAMLQRNFCTSNPFKFEETTILGQDSNTEMCYKYGQAICNIFNNKETKEE